MTREFTYRGVTLQHAALHEFDVGRPSWRGGNFMFVIMARNDDGVVTVPVTLPDTYFSALQLDMLHERLCSALLTLEYEADGRLRVAREQGVVS